jgi:putative copper export protein
MLVAMMTVLAAINRYVFVPRIRFERTKAIAQIKRAPGRKSLWAQAF